MGLRPISIWLPSIIGLIASAIVATLATAPPGHSYSLPRLLFTSVLIILATSLTCAVVMFLTYAFLPPQPDAGPVIRRTSATSAGFAPLVILLQQSSIWAPAVAAFFVWCMLPSKVDPKPQWKKFIGALVASIFLQIGTAASFERQLIVATLALGIAAAPLAWRIRQERPLGGPFQPRTTIAIALLLVIFSKTHYLRLGGAAFLNGDGKTSGAEAKANPPGVAVGGKYRGVILIPEAEQHVTLVPPIPMMGRDPFRMHKDPLGIPFYGVYWFFQPPDRAPDDDAHTTKGSPDQITFRSMDRTPLLMEARQNLGRLIDVSACSRIDITIRNADSYGGTIAIELTLFNTTLHRMVYGQSLGKVPVRSTAPAQETLSFKIPESPAIEQFDELAIRFHESPARATRSAKIAIERFLLVPRG